MTNKTHSALVLFFSFVLVPFACKDSTAPEDLVLVWPGTNKLQVPRSLQLSTESGSGSVSWKSSDNTVAIVSTSGLVTAKFPGSAVVTASRGGRSTSFALTVEATRLEVGPSPAFIALNDTKALTATVHDADGAVIIGVPVKWNTLDPSIATVGATTGVVTGTGEGTTTITATGGGATKDVAILVEVVFGKPLSFSGLASVGNYTCGLEATTGFAYCWGDNHSGALGSGENSGSDFPLLVSGGRRFSSITVGDYSNCGLELQTSLAYCWGYNGNGALGDGTTTMRSAPTLVANGAIRFASISASGDVTCAVEAQTALGYCWGRGELVGDGTTAQRSTPTPVSGNHRFAIISAGVDGACGIETVTGLAYCWGRNDFGQLGDGTTTGRLVPTAVNSLRRFSTISAGGRAACAVEAETGLAYCWGRNNVGQLGDGTTTNRLAPTPVNGSRTFSSISTGFDGTCAVDSQTSAGYCWGLGRNTPTIVGDGSLRFSSLISSYASCGVASETGFGYCWGAALLPGLVPLPIVRGGL